MKILNQLDCLNGNWRQTPFCMQAPNTEAYTPYRGG